jgi:D-glycero-D-manno-heptose 1,7-bisphosphate phosphatase
MSTAVFLDRDGVVNEAIVSGSTARAPLAPGDFVLTPGIGRAVERIRRAGYVVVVVTNQPDIARGDVDAAVVDELHGRLRNELALDAVYCCPHDNADACDCRKPAPGMLLRAAAELDIDLASSWMIGDRWVDVAAAVAAGVEPVLLERAYSWEPTSSGAPPEELRAVWSAPTLAECVDHVLGGITPY